MKNYYLKSKEIEKKVNSITYCSVVTDVRETKPFAKINEEKSNFNNGVIVLDYNISAEDYYYLDEKEKGFNLNAEDYEDFMSWGYTAIDNTNRNFDWHIEDGAVMLLLNRYLENFSNVVTKINSINNTAVSHLWISKELKGNPFEGSIAAEIELLIK